MIFSLSPCHGFELITDDALFRYAFDVIGQLFFSRMFGFMETMRDHRGYIQSLDLLLPVLCAASVMPTYMRPVFLLGGAMIPRVFKALKSIGDIEKAADLCISERQELLSKDKDVEKNDILSSLFDIMREKGDKVDFGHTEIKVEVYVALCVNFPQLTRTSSNNVPVLPDLTPRPPQSRLYCTI